MRSPWPAVRNALLGAALCALAAQAETRPHYGGTLRVETQAAISALPTADHPGGNLLTQEVAGLIFGSIGCAGACRGTPGAFRVAQFVPGKKLTLVANDDYPGGRPYLDSIEILMARPVREQMVDLQLGRADVIDVPVESTRRASQEGVRLAYSAPIELVAVVFPAGGAGDDAHVRDALALSADRAAIFNVLLGRQGASTAALLPDWMTGYAFLFDASQNVTRARQLRQEAQQTELTLAYDPQDTLARAIAERIALDARAAGFAVTPTTSVTKPDAKLARILLPAGDSEAALGAIAAALGGSAPHPGASPEEQYEAERKLRDDLRIVPLVHVPVAYGIAPRVKGWQQPRTGGWGLDEVWLEQRP